MTINIQGLQEDENLVIGLKKQVIEEYWERDIDDFGQPEDTFSLCRNVVEEFIDENNVYFNGKVPRNGEIELPNFLEGMNLMMQSQGFGKSYDTPFAMQYTGKENTSVVVPYRKSDSSF